MQPSDTSKYVSLEFNTFAAVPAAMSGVNCALTPGLSLLHVLNTAKEAYDA